MENSSAIRAKTSYDEEEEHCSYAMQLVTSSSVPMVLDLIIKLNVFEIIAKAGPGAQLSPSQIATHLPFSENPDVAHMLDRLLRLLASHSVLTCSVVGGGVGDKGDQCQRLYGLAPVAKYFLQNQDGGTFRHLLEMVQEKAVMDIWYEFKRTILEGSAPFISGHGHVYKYAETDQKLNESVNKGFDNHAFVVIRKVVQCYKGFEHLKTLVDVGGGLGVALSVITLKYPNIRGINFDLPQVVQNAPTYPGIEHIGGDMFESVPKADAIFMKWVLIDWDDDHCVKLLKNCYKALPDNGKVIVVETISPVVPDNTTASSKSICQVDFMALYFTGGKERTEKEFLALAHAAGFKGIRLVCFTCDMWVMEFYK